MAEESPIIENSENPENPKEEAKTEQVDVDSLMETLEQFDVGSPEKLEGKLQNAADYGKMQSERDQYANELAGLRAEIAEMRKAKPQQTMDDAIDGYQEGQPVDLERLVDNRLNAVLDAREARAAKHQQAMNETWLRISNHKRFPLVEKEFKAALQDPATVMQLQTGQINAMEFFYDMVTDKMANVASQTVKAFKQMRGGGTPIPNLESNARVPQPDQDKRTEKQKKTDELVAKGKQSPGGLHEDEQEMLIDAELGDLFR